jgi:16S rRNA (adenine1518-N6/adenine1519-N6)-dimethyltransferase
MEKLQKKKSLGQHFLHSGHYLSLIADTLLLTKGELVLEIGPGEGALTKVLLDRGAKVVAVEKDARLIPLLSAKFAKEIKNKQLQLVEADALHFDISKCFKKKDAYKTVGNIPYYITGALLKKYLTEAHQPERLVFLIQKEVAERIARSKKESILSLSVKAYGTPTYVKTVPKGAFVPPPKVDSAILVVKDISRKNFKTKKAEGRFFELVKAGFGQKRKLLANNIKKILGEGHSDSLKKVGISEKARAEDVALKEWLAL